MLGGAKSAAAVAIHLLLGYLADERYPKISPSVRQSCVPGQRGL